MIYTVYLDESGTHNGSKCLVVAGYMALPDEWIAFDAEWQGALAEYELTSFHMKDFANRVKSFNGWTDTMRHNCVERLAAVIAKYAWGGFYVLVPSTLYKQIVTPAASRLMGGAYGLAMTVCFFLVVDHLKKVDLSAQIAYVMDRGAEGKGQILKRHVLDQDNPDLSIVSLTFDSTERSIPLQAADILSYELYREYTRQQTNTQWKPRLSHLKTLTAIPVIGGQMTDTQLATWSNIAETADRYNPNLSLKRARQLKVLFPDAPRGDGSA